MRSDFERERSVAPPHESQLSPSFADADTVDAYAVHLPGSASRDIRDVAQAIFGQPAPWFMALLKIRDGVMGNFGVKTSEQLRAGAKQGGAGQIDFFKILSVSTNELVVGEDDRLWISAPRY
jgi:hypothetical protein